jgi:hypothetical protein
MDWLEFGLEKTATAAGLRMSLLAIYVAGFGVFDYVILSGLTGLPAVAIFGPALSVAAATVVVLTGAFTM